MKKVLLLTVFFILTFNAKSQIVTVASDSKNLTTLFSNKFYVVEFANSSLNDSLKAAFAKHWNVGEYEFVTPHYFSQNCGDKTKSFLSFFYIQIEAQTGLFRNKCYYGIVNGGKKQVNYYHTEDIFAFCPVNTISSVDQVSDFNLRIEFMIKGINDALVKCKNKEHDGKIAGSTKAINNNFVEIAKTKILVINKDATTQTHVFKMGKPVYSTLPCVPESSFENYPYKYEFVSESDFNEIFMDATNDEYICLFPVMEANQYVFVYDPSTKETIYIGYQALQEPLTPGNVKMLSLGLY